MATINTKQAHLIALYKEATFATDFNMSLNLFGSDRIQVSGKLCDLPNNFYGVGKVVLTKETFSDEFTEQQLNDCAIAMRNIVACEKANPSYPTPVADKAEQLAALYQRVAVVNNVKLTIRESHIEANGTVGNIYYPVGSARIVNGKFTDFFTEQQLHTAEAHSRPACASVANNSCTPWTADGR